MRVLLTGANGLLGSNIARHLLKRGIEVNAIVRPTSNLISLKGIDINLIEGNFLNSTDVRKALEGCEIVIHAASSTSQKQGSYESHKAINVDGTDLLLELSLNAGVDRFIYVGSSNAFSPGTKENPGNEYSPFSDFQYCSNYMRSKYEAQQHVLQFYKNYNFPVVVVNPTFMLGKYDSKPSSGQILLMSYRRRFMPVPVGGKNFIHVEDVATAIVNSIEKGELGECYLLGNENLYLSSFYDKMKSVCGYPQHQIKLPSISLKLAGYGADIWSKMTGKHSDFNSVNAKLLSSEYFYSSEKAVRKLDLPQTPIEIAIEDALEWFAESGIISGKMEKL